jgi:hypothetical protein
MTYRVSHCCCCVSIKVGIIIIGIFESLWFLFLILSMVGSALFGLDEIYNLLPIFIKPFVVDMPKVLAFICLICASFGKQARQMYYCVRGLSLTMLVLCSIA